MNYITRLEETILIAICKLGDNAYGVTINKEVSKAAQKKYTMGALYFAFDQLVKKGLVSKTLANPTPQRGGRSKTYYCVTKAGIKALQDVKKYQAKLWNGLPDLYKEKDRGK